MATQTRVRRLLRGCHEKIYLTEYFRHFDSVTEWKLFTFFVAGSTITFMGPYTIYAIWDSIEGAFMSILTFLTAPWAVGSIYRRITGINKKSLVDAPLCIGIFKKFLPIKLILTNDMSGPVEQKYSLFYRVIFRMLMNEVDDVSSKLGTFF